MGGRAGSPSNTVWPGPKPASVPSGFFIHIAVCQNTWDENWREGLCPFCGEVGPYLTQCGQGRGLPPYQVASSSIQPFNHNRHGPKIGGCAPLEEEGAGSPSNSVAWAEAYLHTKLHLDTSSRLATTDMGEDWGSCAPLGELGPYLTQCSRNEAAFMPSFILIHPTV